MKKAGRRRSTISTASWRRELSDPQAGFRASRYPGDVAASTEISGHKDSRDGRDWKPREPLPDPLGQREEVDR